MKGEKISVSGDDDISATVHRDLEEEVVVLVPAGVDMFRDLDEFGCCGEKVEELLGLDCGEVAAKLETGGNVTKLGELRIGREKRQVAPREELLENREAATYEETDPEVGINDYSEHVVPVGLS